MRQDPASWVINGFSSLGDPLARDAASNRYPDLPDQSSRCLLVTAFHRSQKKPASHGLRARRCIREIPLDIGPYKPVPIHGEPPFGQSP